MNDVPNHTQNLFLQVNLAQEVSAQWELIKYGTQQNYWNQEEGAIPLFINQVIGRGNGKNEYYNGE